MTLRKRRKPESELPDSEPVEVVQSEGPAFLTLMSSSAAVTNVEELIERLRSGGATYDPAVTPYEAIRLMANGCAISELGRHLAVTSSTIYEWSRKYPEFLGALQIGRELSRAWWLEQGRLNLHNKKFNNALWNSNMLNRFRWDGRNQTGDESKNEDYLPADRASKDEPSKRKSPLDDHGVTTLLNILSKVGAIPDALVEESADPKDE